MKLSALVLSMASVLALGTSAFSQTLSLPVSEDGEYADVTDFSARLTRNVARYEIELETPLDPSEISVWYRPSRTCGSFMVHGVEIMDANGEWVKSIANNYRNTTHYRTSELTSKIAVQMSTDVLFGMNCDVVVRKANFIVPDTLEILARFHSLCADDACTYQAIRIDSPVQEVLTISKEDAERFALENEVIYKLKGYVDPENTDNIFVVKTAQRIL